MHKHIHQLRVPAGLADGSCYGNGQDWQYKHLEWAHCGHCLIWYTVCCTRTLCFVVCLLSRTLCFVVYCASHLPVIMHIVPYCWCHAISRYISQLVLYRFILPSAFSLLYSYQDLVLEFHYYWTLYIQTQQLTNEEKLQSQLLLGTLSVELEKFTD